MVEKSRVQGCLFGLALGDALGAPFEGGPPGEDEGLDLLLDSPPPVLCYTDDTEMAIGVAESLSRKREFDPADMARRFEDNFDPRRGYGPGTVAVLGLIRQGIPYEKANKEVFPEGSFGNGAAMRSAPLGLFARGDMEKLKIIAYGTSAITHAHPLAKEGALLIAKTVALLSGGMKRDEITARLSELSSNVEYAEKLDAISGLLRRDPSTNEIIGLLGNGVPALLSVPTALYAFLRCGNDYLGTIRYCISLGGDTDTISAMAGALAGTHLGAEGLPSELVDRLEDRGRLLTVSDALYEAVNPP